MSNVVIVGPRCVGKTSVGKELSRILSYEFVDADVEFEKEHGSISDFVHNEDWGKFREVEAEVIKEICGKHYDNPIVLSPGGGAVAHNQGEQYRRENVDTLRNFGRIIYLIPSNDLEKSAFVLEERRISDSTSDASRPALTKENNGYIEMKRTVIERHPLYVGASHDVIYTGRKDIEEVTQDLANLVRAA